MWVHEMTDEQKREYGFVKMTVLDMTELGYMPEIGGWKKCIVQSELNTAKIIPIN